MDAKFGAVILQIHGPCVVSGIRLIEVDLRGQHTAVDVQFHRWCLKPYAHIATHQVSVRAIEAPHPTALIVVEPSGDDVIDWICPMQGDEVCVIISDMHSRGSAQKIPRLCKYGQCRVACGANIPCAVCVETDVSDVGHVACHILRHAGGIQICLPPHFLGCGYVQGVGLLRVLARVEVVEWFEHLVARSQR